LVKKALVGSGSQSAALSERIIRVVCVLLHHLAIPLSANSDSFLPTAHLLSASAIRQEGYSYLMGHSAKIQDQ
jgi:hypothetical protein